MQLLWFSYKNDKKSFWYSWRATKTTTTTEKTPNEFIEEELNKSKSAEWLLCGIMAECMLTLYTLNVQENFGFQSCCMAEIKKPINHSKMITIDMFIESNDCEH